MIIFYNKIDGTIIGEIDGRIHSAEHLKMWIGEKEDTERLVVNWKAVGEYKDKRGRVIAQDFTPDIDDKEQVNIHINLDNNSSEVFKYKVDVKTKKLILK
jgi:hypothetical protein